MQRQPDYSEPLSTISIRVPPAMCKEMRRQGPEATRTAMQIGLAIQKDPVFFAALDLHNEANRIRSYIDAMPAGITPAGSHWAPTPAQMPEQLKPGEMVAAPAGVICRLWGGTIAVDMAEGQVQIITESGRTWSHPIDRKALTALVPAVAACLIPLATSEPGAVFRLGVGLHLERVESGSLVISGGGISLGLGMAEAFAWSAELAGLLAGRLKAEGSRLMQLEGSLAAAPAAVEVER